MQNDVKPVPGQKTEGAVPQAGQAMVVPADKALPNESMENARQGGRIYTVAFAADETRPQELHGAVNYQKWTADPAQTPPFIAYTDLTVPKNTSAINAGVGKAGATGNNQ